MSRPRRVLCSFVCIGVIAACQPPPSPPFRPFGDNQHWIVIEDLEYFIGSTQDRIVVPKGFVTDFASIPQVLSSMGLGAHGQYSRAAVIHDYLYWSQGCTRAQADRLLLIAMKESNVGRFDEAVVYQGVNLGGQASWDRNANERREGLPRVVPSQYLRPSDPNMNWPTYRDILVRQGVKDPPYEQNPRYCRYGDSTAVP